MTAGGGTAGLRPIWRSGRLPSHRVPSDLKLEAASLPVEEILHDAQQSR